MIIIPEDVLRIAEALSAPIDELGLSVRSYNGLRRWGITTVADVYRAHQDKQLPRIRNLGEKSVIEIEKHLEEHLAKVAPASSSEIPNSSDTISRAKAIEAIDEIESEIAEGFGFEYEKWRKYFCDLPPAQPDIIRCKDCKHWIPYDWMFSEVWRSKNMTDYPEDEIGCNWCDMAMKANDFCSRGERRTDG